METQQSAVAHLTAQELALLQRLREVYVAKLADPSTGFSLLRVFPLPSDLPAVYDQLTQLKTCLDSFRPFDVAQAAKLREVFDTEYTYNSNRIEGNTLSLRETDLVVNRGITIAGKPFREHLEAINHQEAIGFVRDLVDRIVDLTPYNLKQIHALILHGIDRDNAGRYRGVPVFIRGSRHMPPQPYMIDKLMEDMFIFYNDDKDTKHPVEIAAQMHEKLVTIHPFIDGNGRTSRLIMNLILLRAGYPLTILSGDDAARSDDFRAIETANISPDGDNREFQHFIAANVRTWLLRYLELVSVDLTEAGMHKGRAFFETIAPSLGIARP